MLNLLIFRYIFSYIYFILTIFCDKIVRFLTKLQQLQSNKLTKNLNQNFY